MKDIFIDNQIAIKFACTDDPNLNELIDWLTSDQEDPNNNAYLLVSNLLIKEYLDSNRHCDKGRSISTIFNKLLIKERLNKKSNKELENFKIKYFTKKIWEKLNCKVNKSNDPYHVILICISDRQMGISEDEDLLKDLGNLRLKGIDLNIQVERKIENLNYK